MLRNDVMLLIEGGGGLDPYQARSWHVMIYVSLGTTKILFCKTNIYFYNVYMILYFITEKGIYVYLETQERYRLGKIHVRHHSFMWFSKEPYGSFRLCLDWPVSYDHIASFLDKRFSSVCLSYTGDPPTAWIWKQFGMEICVQYK